MSTIQVVPTDFVVPITHFKIDWYFNLNLNVSATFTVFVFNNSQQLYSKQIVLLGDDYKKWGNDDNYLTNFVAKQLGLKIQETTGVTGSSDATGVTGSSDASGPTGSSDASGPTGAN